MTWLMKRWHRGLMLGWFLGNVVPDDGVEKWVVLVLCAAVLGILMMAAQDREDRLMVGADSQGDAT